MMKKPLLILTCLTGLSGAAFGQSGTLTFDDGVGIPNSGTYSQTSTFSVNVNLTVAGFTSNGLTAGGLSYWLEVPTAVASNISITANNYFTFTFPDQNTVPKVFTDSSGADPGFRSDFIPSTDESGDLGAIANNNTEKRGDGTYNVTNLTFSLSNLPAGDYTIRTTTLSTKSSEVNDTTANFNTYNIPQAIYSFTVVPEPATFSLVALGGLGLLGARALRRRSNR